MESITPLPKNTKNTKNTKSTKKKLSVMGNKSKSDSHMEERNTRVAVLAYYKAQARRFEPGSELVDWLAAEAEVDNNMLLQ